MVCEWFVLKTTRMVFTGFASNPVVMVSTGLASKPAATVFTGLTSKPVATVFSSLASKLVATVSPDLASKPVVGFLVEPQNQGGGGFFGLGLKTDSYGFGDLGLKITATVSWFRPQNYAGFSLSVAPQNQWREIGVGHASRFSGLLHMETSLVRVSQYSLKIGRGATAGGARGTIFNVLGPRGIVVI
jgi:hypothetical protein